MIIRTVLSPNRAAFWAMIGVSEGTSTSPATKCGGYDVIVTGLDKKPEIFTDFSDHPFNRGRKPKVINRGGLRSSASGFAQFMLKDWHYYRDLLHLTDKTKYPDGAFSPDAQIAWGFQLIKERRALPLIDAGRFAEAVARCSNIWASFTGAGYGQHENPIEQLEAAYTAAGGTLA